MKLKTFILIFFMLITTFVWAKSADSILADTSEEKNTLKNKYSDNESIWGFKLGYFPIWEEDFSSSGISGTFYSESTISKLFKLGWSFQLNMTVEDDGGYLFVNGYLSHPIKIENHTLLIKGGAGIAAIIYPSLAGLLEIEYLIWEFEETAISVSISECIPGFQMLMPPIISIGILF
jgi:hypothetical protein